MTDNKQVEFIPFHAINEFMRNDFRISVIRSTLTALPKLSPEFSKPVDRLTRKFVKVAGFRNSVKAPASVKAVAMVKAFENQPKLVASILHAWSESEAELRQEIFDLLTELIGQCFLLISLGPGFQGFSPNGQKRMITKRFMILTHQTTPKVTPVSTKPV